MQLTRDMCYFYNVYPQFGAGPKYFGLLQGIAKPIKSEGDPHRGKNKEAQEGSKGQAFQPGKPFGLVITLHNILYFQVHFLMGFYLLLSFNLQIGYCL